MIWVFVLVTVFKDPENCFCKVNEKWMKINWQLLFFFFLNQTANLPISGRFTFVSLLAISKPSFLVQIQQRQLSKFPPQAQVVTAHGFGLLSHSNSFLSLPKIWKGRERRSSSFKNWKTPVSPNRKTIASSLLLENEQTPLGLQPLTSQCQSQCRPLWFRYSFLQGRMPQALGSWSPMQETQMEFLTPRFWPYPSSAVLGIWGVS